MKKVIRYLSLIMVLVLGMTMISGCASDEEEIEFSEDMQPFTLKVGLPIDDSVDNWADWEYLLNDWIDQFKNYENVTLEFTTIPTDEDELDDFMSDVDSGDIACFLSGEAEWIDELIEDKSLISLDDMRYRYVTLMETATDTVFTLSQEKDLSNYKIPVYGSYQGLYYNRTLFKELKLENPTSWENVMKAVEVLNKEGYTPIAAGFEDEGFDYFMEEMVLSEGGTAEHSYMPSFGVISSWERAVQDVKTLQKAGAFTKDCYNTSFDTAVDSFLNGEAAMIVAPSDAFGGQLSEDDVKVVGFPNTPTGKREDGAFIGELSNGIYVSKSFFNDSDTRYADEVILLINDYFLSGEFYELVKDESTLSASMTYYDDYSTTHMDAARGKLIKDSVAADWSMRRYAHTYDSIMDGFRKAVLSKKPADELQKVTDIEIKAAEKAAAEKEDE